MTIPLITGCFNPSLVQLNDLITQINAALDNVSVPGNAAISGTLTVTGASTLNGGLRLDATTALTAVGTNRATSLALTATVNNITSAASGTGVTAPACAVGKIVVINNLGANAIQVYGAGSDTIDGAAAATGVPLTNAKRVILVGVSATAYVTLMGVASA